MKLSIITATKNCAATVADCLTSVSRQTHPDIEHIIIDGASTDDTVGIVQGSKCELERRMSHNESPLCASRVTRVVSEPDQGIYDAMNKGVLLATGDVIGTLNSNDCYVDAEVLARVAAVFEDPAVMSCYGDLVYVKDTDAGRGALTRKPGTEDLEPGICDREPRGGENSSPFTLHPSPSLLPASPLTVVRFWKAGEFNPRSFYWGWMPPHPTFFVRRRIYEQYGIFNLNLGTSADYDLMLRFLLKQRISSVYIPHIQVAMRLGGVSNASVKNRLQANLMDRQAWKVNGITPYPWTLTLKPLRKITQWIVMSDDPIRLIS